MKRFARCFAPSNVRSSLGSIRRASASSLEGGGRTCPLSYFYGPTAISSTANDEEAGVLFVVGGMYGNVEALAAVESRLVEERHSNPVAVFNGDFNFFNVDPSEFSLVNRSVMARHKAIAGNVEVEAVNIEASSILGSSCGCAYPMYVDDGVVGRSNSIVGRLQKDAALLPEHADIASWLRDLPRFMGFRVGGYRVGVIHGDPNTLAGWAFSAEAMEPADHKLRASLECSDDPAFEPTTEAATQKFFQQAAVDIFACTHTCLPFAQTYEKWTADGGSSTCAVINNGSAGMPNSTGAQFGIMTRIADTTVDPTPPHDSLYGAYVGKGDNLLRVDAIPVRYDHSAWMRRFARNWPTGSPADVSYSHRIFNGPKSFDLHQAARRGFKLATPEGKASGVAH